MGPLYYNLSHSVVAESWARGVDWDLTRMVYPDYLGVSFLADHPDYTPVVVDMIDGGSDVNSGVGEKKGDKVTGYTIRQIEDALQRKRTWESWKENIKNKYNNGTEQHLDDLFYYWHD